MATQYVTCPRCSAQNSSLNTTCMTCGSALPIAPMPMQQMPRQPGAQIPGADKKILAGILAIVLGSFGVHKFVLGYQQEGIILIGVTVVAWIVFFITCGIGFPLLMIPSVIGIVEGIMYLTKSDEEFVQTYIVNKKPWF
jgi:TM2 domain-containing membrane protein YozV